MSVESQANGTENASEAWRELGSYRFRLGYMRPEDHPSIIGALRQNPQPILSELKKWDNLSNIVGIYGNTEVEKRQGSDIWLNNRMDAYDGMYAILTSGIPRDRLEDATPLTTGELSCMRANGIGLFQELLQASDPTTQMELTNFLSYSLWLTQRELIESGPRRGGEPSLFHRKKQIEFEHKKALLIPLLARAGHAFASRGEVEHLELVYQGFKNIEDDEASLSLLFDSDLSQEERLTAAVGYINTYGFIKGINVLAQSIKNTDAADVREELTTIYRTLQGDDVEEVMAELSEVYSAVDFEHYPLNVELTQEECDRIEIVLHKNAIRNKHENVYDLHMLDLGAGTGRHMLELMKRGYTKVKGVEQEQKHVDIIRSKNSDADIHQGNWESLPEVVPADYRADVIYCLGRTLPHNRTSIEMLKFFDQLQATLSNTGDIFVDLPDETGVYEKRISALRENAKALGIKPSVNDIIFDGPDENHKFNRYILRREQVEALGSLFGFHIADAYSTNIGEGEDAIQNRYYHLERNSAFDPKSISGEEFRKKMDLLGLSDVDNDFNTFIQSWGMKLGQAFLYTPGNEKIKSLVAEAREKQLPKDQWGPTVRVFEHGGYLELESSGLPKGQWNEVMRDVH